MFEKEILVITYKYMMNTEEIRVSYYSYSRIIITIAYMYNFFFQKITCS